MCGGSDAALRLRGCEEDGRNRQAVTELEGGRIEPLAEGLLTLRTGPANNLTRFCRHPHRVRSPFSGARFRGKGRCLFPVTHDHNCHSSAIDVDHAKDADSWTLACRGIHRGPNPVKIFKTGS